MLEDLTLRCADHEERDEGHRRSKRSSAPLTVLEPVSSHFIFSCPHFWFFEVETYAIHRIALLKYNHLRQNWLMGPTCQAAK